MSTLLVIQHMVNLIFRFDLAFVLFVLSFLLGRGVLVLLVLRYQVIHVRLGLKKNRVNWATQEMLIETHTLFLTFRNSHVFYLSCSVCTTT